MRTRILVVDDFYPDPDAVRHAALDLPFIEHPEYHKGKRTQGVPLGGDLAATLARFLFLDPEFVNGYSCYQCCIAGDQLVFHSDAQQWAAAVYLTPDAPPSSGTTFYRSRLHPSVRSAEHLGFNGATEENVYRGKVLDRTAWEEVDRIGNVFNRLVVWDARMVHAATDYFGTGLDNGRLFQMVFFDTNLVFSS